MISRQGRRLAAELLDAAPAEEAAANLRDLARINRWLGGHRVLLSVLRRVVQPGERFSLLDAGAGSGDAARAILRKYPAARVVSLDRRPLHLSPAPSERVAADAFRLPFPDRSFDFVHCALFLHHFPDEQVVELMASLRRVARRALIAVDLERHPLPYHFLPLTRWLFRWQPITVHDGCISVAAGFRPLELERLARAAGAMQPAVRRHLPWFRISLLADVG